MEAYFESSWIIINGMKYDATGVRQISGGSERIVHPPAVVDHMVVLNKTTGKNELADPTKPIIEERYLPETYTATIVAYSFKHLSDCLSKEIPIVVQGIDPFSGFLSGKINMKRSQKGVLYYIEFQNSQVKSTEYWQQ